MKNEEKNECVLKISLIGLAFAIAVPTSASAAEATISVATTESSTEAAPPPRVLSAFAREGGTIAAGATVLVDLPAVDLRYRQSFGSDLAFDGQLSSSGLAQTIRAGVRAAVSNDERSAIAIRLSAFEGHNFENDPQIILGFGPGALISIVEGSVTLTAELDTALAYFDVSRFLHPSAGIVLRPALGAEVVLSPKLTLILEAGTTISFFDHFVVPTPVASALLAW